MQIHNISKQDSILNTFIAEIRDVTVQRDAMRFRRNIERIGEILGYELSKSLRYTPKVTKTPLGQSTDNILDNDIVLCSILRAGLPLHNGLLHYFDKAENAFISAYRSPKANTNSFTIVTEYFAAPSLEKKTLLLIDPMLATGKSLVAVYDAIKNNGAPEEIHIVSVLGTTEGIDFVEKHFPENTHLWIAAIDATLNEKGYIIPGLGDAGDLAFGTKQ
ncbi:uracil phosphoribosyltransferase [Tenacibaculum sp. SG-28]|uniref:uracil phosphoribosyltransferase n=1 Tax=Tenacibaculum sp. SG-28 TaxID=754426 RepID=UPI000CF55303|nr:uracil phosphoribosyltransferase [Tenacibaculum sp. SG-28]PQJ21893.1 uracil phosphoribosyltransferase [Tenacibaculum sp. SG-28]